MRKKRLFLFHKRVLLSLIILPVLLLYSCTSETKTQLLRDTSPEGRYSATVEYSPPPAFGTHSIEVTITDQHVKNKRSVIHYELHNDGTNLRDDNVKLVWQGLYLVLIFTGEEQDADSLTLNLRTMKLIPHKYVN